MSRDALIVGINRYQYLSSLKAPAKDAEAIAHRLEQDGDFRVWRLPEQIDPANGNRSTVSSTQQVLQVQLEQALKQLFRPDSTQAPETALFYFSGHGIPDKDGFDKGYLAASDTNSNTPRAGLSLRWLQWLLSESPVKQQIIWLDCCHSGSLIVNVGAANPGNSESRDRCFIASSRDFETSWEDLNSQYSVLTKALLEGLEPSRLPGRWIDTFALVDYVNQALKGELQTPVCTNFGEAINLTRTWQVEDQATKQIPVDSGICPYKGLEFFDCNDEDPKYFFGREKLVGQLLDQVRTSNFMALVGASGNGKSSVLRAGLLHQLKLGRRSAGSDQWQILITRPDIHPMQNLAAVFVPEGGSQLDRAGELGKAIGLLKEGAAGLQRLVEVSTAPRTILVIDQFEEVFTRCDSNEEREQLFGCLMGALEETGDKFCLIIAMRADFVGKCLEQDYSGLAQQLQQHMISVLPLTADELRDAICKPAEQANLTIEPALVTEILNDIKGAPGSLPLLQYTLKELWQRRQESTLMLSTYQELGGINGTLDKRATEIYNRFNTDQQRTVQHIFQQLTQLGEGTEDTRRRVFLDNLISEPLHPVEIVRTVIDTLSSKDNRLLVTSELIGKGDVKERRAIVDVAHEALIRHWRLLRQWIEKNRDLLRQQRRIEASAVTWQEHNQLKGYLLQGLSLNEALQFQKHQVDTFPLSEPAKNFIQKSVWQKRRNLLKASIWLVIPAVIIAAPVEHFVREDHIKKDYSRLDSENKSEEKQAVQELVAGCSATKSYAAVPEYFLERVFGHCRSLKETRLSAADLSGSNLPHAELFSSELNNADLRSANLSYADLRYTNFSNADLRDASLGYADLRNANFYDAILDYASFLNADLRGANFSNAYLHKTVAGDVDLSSANFSFASLSADLSSANLSSADFSNAALIDANLRYANLENANLSFAIILATDLRAANRLTQTQLEGENSPFICNAPLPENIEIQGGKDRDCDKLADILHQRYPDEFENIEAAAEFVNEQRQRPWE
ncbi:pentapeptide repeat-containing protein [Leptothoe sp. EHU-05/26/07-4]